MISNKEIFSYICLALRPLHHQLITAYATWSARVLSGGKKLVLQHATTTVTIALLILVFL